MKSLVIVESPAKAKTINKILGPDFEVKASIGHIIDLPKSKMGVDVKNDFKPDYIVISGKEKIIRELKKSAKSADTIYLALDPDREGEAIAWHVSSEISGKKDVHRVIFHEITPKAVLEAIKNPTVINENKVDAQQARRILDRLVGYNLSPLLWKKVSRGLSAGRVQSVAVRLIVDRERDIEAFKKDEYWSIEALFSPASGDKAGGVQFPARLYKYRDSLVINRESAGDSRFLIQNEETANTVASEIRGWKFSLEKIDKKLRKRMPFPPFITSTLQQEAARKLRFPAKKTMMLAQQLYEGIELGKEGSVGLITYMRTDSLRIAPDAQKAAIDFINKNYGKDYVPEKPHAFKSKALAQEAHEAIRPTYIERTPESLKLLLPKDLFGLYKLIWNRFISSQMAQAELEQTTFIIGADGRHGQGEGNRAAEFRASGTVVRFEGFMALYTEGKDEIEEEDGVILPRLKEGESLMLADLTPKQHFTLPPPRFTEATLIKMLEEKGIGRPSTYATILSTIQDRKYVNKIEGRFSPTELGSVVNDFLTDRFPELIDIGFTAKLEDKLDHIEDGKYKWVRVVKDFYGPFVKELDEASNKAGKVKPQDIETEEKCEKCGSPMVIRWGRHGRFKACSGYPKCKNTKPLDEQGSEQGALNPDLQPTGEECEKCGSPMVIKSGRFGKFFACSKYPECKNTKPIPTGVKCPEDSGDIVEKRSRKGKPFWSCSNYPKCKFASWYKPLSMKCPGCNAAFLVEKRDKEGNVYHCCAKKECGFREKLVQ